MPWLRQHAREATIAILIATSMLLVDLMGGFHLFDNALVVALRNDNVYFDTVGSTPEHLRRAVEELGSDRIMFGTDWSATWRWVRDPGDVHQMRLATIAEAGLSAGDLRAALALPVEIERDEATLEDVFLAVVDAEAQAAGAARALGEG